MAKKMSDEQQPKDVEEAPVFPLELVDRYINGVPESPYVQSPFIVPETPVEDVQVPSAEIVLDADKGKNLLRGINRPVEMFESVTFLGQGIPETQVGFLGMLAYQAVKPNGFLFIPAALAEKVLPNLPGEHVSEPVEGLPFIKLTK